MGAFLGSLTLDKLTPDVVNACAEVLLGLQIALHPLCTHTHRSGIYNAKLCESSPLPP